MDLVTCANKKYLNHANNLALTFLAVYNTKAHICIFEEDKNNLPLLNNINIIYHFLEKDVPFAFEPSLYYYKVATLEYAINNCDNEFLYLDTRFRVLSRPYDIESKLEECSRFFLQYPPIEIFKNKYWTTKKCIKKCNGEKSNENYVYWAAIQAYTITDENKKFITHFLDLYKDIEVAGPSSYISFPEGAGAICKAHKCDQSVLTMLINNYGFQQPFSQDLTSKYGDIETLKKFNYDNKMPWNTVLKGRCKLGENKSLLESNYFTVYISVIRDFCRRHTPAVIKKIRPFYKTL